MTSYPPLSETDLASRAKPTLGLLPLLAVTAAIASPAMAQQSGDDKRTNLGTIILESGTVAVGEAASGYKVSESSNDKVLTPLLDTPKTIKVITRKEMQERGQTSLADVLRTTPGITLGTGEGGNPAGVMPTIRGGNATNDILVDGFRSPLRTDYEAFNLETIEITKGPGGTASGTGSTGGTVNLTSKTPVKGDFNDVSLSFGTGAYKRATLDMNRDLGDLGLRLNLMVQDADSLGGREGLTSERFGIAPSISYRISDATKLTAGLYFYKDEGLIDYGVPLSTATTPDAFRRGSGTAADPFLPADVPTDHFYGLQNRDFNDVETRSAFVRLDHELAPNLTWSTMLRATRNEKGYVVSLPAGIAGGLVSRATRSSDRVGEDVALNSQLTGEAELWGMKHRFAFGVDLANTEVTAMIGPTITNPAGFDPASPYANPDPYIPWGGTIVRNGPNTITKYKTRGIYAFDVVELAPQWEASFGLRFDKFDASTYSVASGAVTNENDSSFWNGNLGLVYKPSDNGSVYFSVGSSANPAGEGNGVGGGPDSSLSELDPERAYSYELGTKWSLFDNRLFLSAAVYLIEKDNARQTNEFGEAANIGKTRSQGFELDVAGQINDRWSVSAGYAYTDARIVDAGFTCTGTPAVCTPSANNGSRVAGTPLHSFSLWTNYEVNDKLSVGGGATFIDERPLNAAQTVMLPDQVRVDLTAAYNITDTTAIRFSANNIFDEQLYSGNRGNGWANVEPGRNFVLTLNHSF